MSMNKDSGSCFCNKITFKVWDFDPKFTICHCTECQTWTGSLYASITVNDGNYKIQGAENITWHKQGTIAERGFCKHCGSNIFWRLLNRDVIQNQFLDFAIGMLAQPENLTAKKHIFCKSKLSFYDLPNNQAIQHPQGSV